MKRTASLAIALFCLGLVAGCGAGESQAMLRTAVDAKSQELNQCYATALARDREIAGIIEADLVVDNFEGRVTRIEFTGGDAHDAALESCMSDALTQVQIAEPPVSNLRAEYTFELTPLD